MIQLEVCGDGIRPGEELPGDLQDAEAIGDRPWPIIIPTKERHVDHKFVVQSAWPNSPKEIMTSKGFVKANEQGQDDDKGG